MQSILKSSSNQKKKKNVNWNIFRDVDSTWSNQEYDRSPHPLYEQLNSMEEARLKVESEERQIMEKEKRIKQLNYYILTRSKRLQKFKRFI